MWKPTRIGALVLLLSLFVARFVDIWAGAVLAVIGGGLLVIGLINDRRAQRAAAATPPVSWAEEFTARVRAERAAAAERAAQRAAAEHAAVRAVQEAGVAPTDPTPAGPPAPAPAPLTGAVG